jgi:hypothetical protein
MRGRPAARASRLGHRVKIERDVHRVASPRMVEHEFQACGGWLRNAGPAETDSRRRELSQRVEASHGHR